MEQKLKDQAVKLKTIRSQSKAENRERNLLKEKNPKIINCSLINVENKENICPPNFKNLKYWKIISTDIGKNLLKNPLRKNERDFRLSKISEFKFMYDETLEI